VRNHYTLRLAMAMWTFVTRGQSTRTYPGLPDPEKVPTPEAAASMKAANDEIITHLNGKSITSIRGVKRKRENNTYDATTRAKIGRYATEHSCAYQDLSVLIQ
jgi:hypothetical protein